MCALALGVSQAHFVVIMISYCLFGFLFMIPRKEEEEKNEVLLHLFFFIYLFFFVSPLIQSSRHSIHLHKCLHIYCTSITHAYGGKKALLVDCCFHETSNRLPACLLHPAKKPPLMTCAHDMCPCISRECITLTHDENEF